jgi:hypothetical protein
LPRHVAAAISWIEIKSSEDKDGNKYETIKLKLHDKVKCLELLSKMRKLLDDMSENVNSPNRFGFSGSIVNMPERERDKTRVAEFTDQ